MKEFISAAQARRMLTDTGWRMVQQGYEFPVRCADLYNPRPTYYVGKAGQSYYRKPVPRLW